MSWLKRNWPEMVGVALWLVLFSGMIGVCAWIADHKTPAQSEKDTQPKLIGDTAAPIRDRVRERVLLAVVRHRAIAAMERDGFALVGGDKLPLSRADAERLYDRLTDEVVLGAAKEASPRSIDKLGDGTLLANLLTWISEHQEEILAILKLVLAILALL